MTKLGQRKRARWLPTFNQVYLLILLCTMIFLAIQSFALLKQNDMLTQETDTLNRQVNILQAEYEASFRPYLTIENITVEQGSEGYVQIVMDVTNRGKSPATNVSLEAVIGGAYVTYDESTGIYTFIYTSEGDYVTPIQGDFPTDLLFFPGVPCRTSLSAYEPVYVSTVEKSGEMHIALEYFWGEKQYLCVTKATLWDGVWVVDTHRGY